MKEKHQNQRVVVWNYPKFKGMTAEIIYVTPDFYRVSIDGVKDHCAMTGRELYFPDHPLAYNQDCFQ